MDDGHDADETALGDGYVSIVPVKFDLTAHEHLQQLRAIFQ